MSALMQDLKYASRSFRASRGSAIFTMLVLAITIGHVTAIFSLVDAALLRPRDFHPSPQLVAIHEYRQPTGTSSSVSPTEFTQWRQSHSTNPRFGQIAAFYSDTVTITGDYEPERLQGARVSSGFFEVLQVPLQSGRTFHLDEERGGSNDVAIVANALWQRYFGSSALAGQRLRLDGVSVEIVGIAREGFGFPEATQIWRPISLDPGRVVATHYLSVIARLGPDVTSASAGDYLERLNAYITVPTTNTPTHRVRIMPLHEVVVGELRTAILVLVAAITLVLLLACFSVASVQFARAAQRQDEIAMKIALGASRQRIIRQLLLEGIVLAAPAAVLGMLLGNVSLRLLVALHADQLKGLTDIRLNLLVGALAMVVAIAAGILSSLLPALYSTRINVTEQFRGSGTTVIGRRSYLTRHTLVSAQFAIAVMLTVGAGLMLRSFDALKAVNPGFDSAGVLTLETNLPAARYPAPRIAQFYANLFERLEALPVVKSAGVVLSLPLRGGRATRTFSLDGTGSTDSARASVNTVSPGYFRTMAIPLLAGRDFTIDDVQSAESVIIINRRLANRVFNGSNPIGRVIRFGDALGNESSTIIGVVGDIRQSALQVAAEPEIYSSRLRSPRLTLVAKFDGDLKSATAILKSTVHAIDSELPVSPTPMQDVVEATIGLPALRASLLSIFAAFAVMLAIVGLSGLMAAQVRERLPELGLRMALGGRPRQIVQLIARTELVWPLGGVAIGTIGALAGTRVVASLLFEVSPTDVRTFTVTLALLVMGIGVAAAYPVSQALRADATILIHGIAGRQ